MPCVYLSGFSISSNKDGYFLSSLRFNGGLMWSRRKVPETTPLPDASSSSLRNRRPFDVRCMSVGVYLCISGTRQRALQRSLTSPTPPFDLFLHRHCLFLALPVCAQLTVVVVPCECWVRHTDMVECHWLRLWRGRSVCLCVCVCDVSQETEQTALDHSANMSTEIKLVYYFQRGEKNKTKQNKTKKFYETKEAVIFYTSDYY